MRVGQAAWSALRGRADEVELLLAHLERGAADGAALMMAGKAGVGKTALLSATLTAGRASGWTVLSASGVQFESAIGYSTLNQLLLTVHDQIARQPAVSSELSSVALGLAGAGAPRRSAVTEAVLMLCGELAASAPLLIAIDDLQWVDLLSAEVLAALARQVPAHVTVLAAYRSDSTAAVNLDGIAHHTIAPLAADAADQLLTDAHPDLGPRARHSILSQAEGIPLLLVELPNALDERQRHDLDPTPPILPLSDRLHDVFAEHVKALPAPARRTLLLAALDGHGDLAVLARARGTDPAALEVDDDLLAAAAARLVAIDSGDDGTDSVVFAHPLIRATVVELAGAQEMRRAHKALAHAHANTPERRAWHLGQAATGPDEDVAAALEHAATSALRRGDGLGALNALIRAGELSPDTARRRRRLAQAAYLGVDVTGDLHRAAALLADIRGGSTRQPMEVVAAAAHALLVGEGDLDTAHRMLVASLHSDHSAGVSGPDAAATRLPALYSLFEVCLYAGRPELWPPLRAAVAELGPAAPVHLRLLMSVLADPARCTDAALAELDDALARANAQHDPTVIEPVAASALFVDRAGECHSALWEIVESGRAGSAATSAVNAAMVLWADNYHSGQWDSGAALTAEGQDLCRRHGLQLYAAPLRYGAGLVAAARGEHIRARQLAQAIDRFAAPRGMRSVQCLGWHVLALSACGRGDYADAHRLFTQITGDGAVPENAPHALWMILELVESAMRCERHDYARTQVRSLVELDVARISPRLALVCSGAQALVADRDEASAHFDAALAMPGASRWPFDHARIELAYGEHLRRRRALRHARQHLLTALDVFGSLGATPWLERAGAELRAAGTPRPSHQQRSAPQRSDPAGNGSSRQRPELSGQRRSPNLTPQELQIAMLVAAGLTNKQIGERLMLSPRTVAAHLRQVFPKLEISSRAAMRDALADRASVSGPS